MNPQHGSQSSRLTQLAVIAFLVAFMPALCGCASKPKLTHTGFLSDYSRLEPVSDSRMRYQSQRIAGFNDFVVDPIRVTVPADKLSESDRDEVRSYFRDKVIESLRQAGHRVVSTPGPGVARIRIALTDVAASTWWQKVHPVSRAVGAGTGGAAMEAEIIDSQTKEQLGAVVQAGTGNQFDMTAFSTVADVKSAIDGWVQHFSDRLKELRAQGR